MKRVLKLVFTFLIFYLGWKWFPDIITFTGIPAVAVTTLLFFLISIPYELFFIALIIMGMVYIYDKYPVGFGILTIILCEVSMSLYSIIVIMLLSKFYSGFAFTGGIFALILFAFVLAFVNTDTKNSKKNND